MSIFQFISDTPRLLHYCHRRLGAVGAKEMLLVDNVNNRAFLRELLEAMYEELLQ